MEDVLLFSPLFDCVLLRNLHYFSPPIVCNVEGLQLLWKCFEVAAVEDGL